MVLHEVMVSGMADVQVYYKGRTDDKVSQYILSTYKWNNVTKPERLQFFISI